jgi:hypothetical protein
MKAPALQCPNCSAELPPVASICGECGHVHPAADGAFRALIDQEFASAMTQLDRDGARYLSWNFWTYVQVAFLFGVVSVPVYFHIGLKFSTIATVALWLSLSVVLIHKLRSAIWWRFYEKRTRADRDYKSLCAIEGFPLNEFHRRVGEMLRRADSKISLSPLPTSQKLSSKGIVTIAGAYFAKHFTKILVTILSGVGTIVAAALLYKWLKSKGIDLPAWN